MTKIEKTGAAPVSKYAAKKAAQIKNNEVEITKENAVVENPVSNINEATEIKEDENPKVDNTIQKPKKDKKNNLPSVTNRYPDHIVQIALIIKNNAEIRRFTALGILNYLLQKGEIKGNARYVSFKWNKFAVKCNGLMREYSYNEPFFLNALVASFASFSASAQRTIDNFCRQEMYVSINKAVDSEEVDNIIALNEEYQGTGEEGKDDTARVSD